MGGSIHGFSTLIARMAYGYVGVVFVFDILLLVASVMLHMGVLVLDAKQLCGRYGITLLTGTVVGGLLVAPFIKNGLMWVGQIKSCPRWMWRSALALGAYSLFVLCFQVIFPEGAVMSDQVLAVSAFPIGFDAIYFCVLYSVLSVGYLERREVIKRAAHSAVIAILGLLASLAYHRGYLDHLRRN